MSLLRAHRRFIAWLAMLAMGWGALAPAMAQAVVATSDDAAWVQLCTASGMIWVQFDGGGGVDGADPAAPASDGSSSAMKCPWCLLHGGVDALPAVQVELFVPGRLTDLPPAFYRAPTASFAWAVHRSRAPPLTS